MDEKRIPRVNPEIGVERGEVPGAKYQIRYDEDAQRNPEHGKGSGVYLESMTNSSGEAIADRIETAMRAHEVTGALSGVPQSTLINATYGQYATGHPDGSLTVRTDVTDSELTFRNSSSRNRR
jgi:hypothetical protein